MKIKVTTTNYDDMTASKVQFVKNCPSFLFSDAQHELNGVEIDRIRNVGLTSTMKLTTAQCIESNTLGYYYFSKTFDGKLAQSKDPKTYDLMIPLSVWLGFCDDFQKVIVNSRHELILNRSRNSVNCFHGGADSASFPSVNIDLLKLEWKMPYIALSDKMKINHFLSKEKRLPIQFRTWDLYEYPELRQTTSNVWTVKTVSQMNKPRFVIVGFQHKKIKKKPKTLQTLTLYT